VVRHDRIYWQVTSVLGKKIHTTKSYWEKIVTTKHPAIKGRESEVKKTLTDADEVRDSKADNTVFLYYRATKKGFLCVVAKHQNSSGFIITAYITEKIKEGRTIWRK
jgi:hypothetical protein